MPFPPDRAGRGGRIAHRVELLMGRQRTVVRENEINLNIPRYLGTSEAPQEIDIAAVQGGRIGDIPE